MTRNKKIGVSTLSYLSGLTWYLSSPYLTPVLTEHYTWSQLTWHLSSKNTAPAHTWADTCPHRTVHLPSLDTLLIFLLHITDITIEGCLNCLIWSFHCGPFVFMLLMFIECSHHRKLVSSSPLAAAVHWLQSFYIKEHICTCMLITRCQSFKKHSVYFFYDKIHHL